MPDEACVEFLRWCLPRLGLRWAGFRRVHRTVCKRLRRRRRELGLPDLAAYRAFVEASSDEWRRLDAMCRIPISRFYRDRAVFDALAGDVLPGLARAVSERGGTEVRCWSAGCASGEEPYTLAMIGAFVLRPAFPALRFAVLGTDADGTMLARAEAGCYGRGSLRELPPDWAARALERRDDGLYRVRDDLRHTVALRRGDIRAGMPPGPFELILCRNLAFTYFAPDAQRGVLAGLVERLAPGGVLVVGRREVPPADAAAGLTAPWAGLPIYTRRCA